MNTSLAYVNSAAEVALSAGPPVRRRRVDISGFQVTEESVNKVGFESYRRAAVELRNLLDTRGIEPLAVLPASWWERMCDEAGLVVTSRDDANRLRLNTVNLQGVTMLTTMTGMALVGGTTGLVSAYQAGGDLLSTALPVALAGALIASLSIIVPPVTRLAAWPAARLVIRMMGRSEALRHAARGGRDREPGTVGVAFKLPEPPADVASVLLGLRDLAQDHTRNYGEPRLRVAAEPSAFALEQSLERLVIDGITSRTAARWERLGAEMADPIIFIERGGAVAIVAQFGDFAIERELVDRVIASTGI